MKLVEILARELEKWPEGVTVAVQDNYGSDKNHIWFCDGKSQGISRIEDEDGWIIGCGVRICDYLVSSFLASDHATAIVTREMWQAERERIAKPGKKDNEEGWIRNRGRKCPVQSGTLVDLKLRGGVIHIGKFCDNHPWIHTGEPFDVMYYRINKTAEQQERSAIVEQMQEQCAGLVEKANGLKQGGPLEWRDRITEIDRTVEALEEERVALVQRLAGDGFRLIGRVNELLTNAAQKHEDMSDWRNWRSGDQVKVILNNDCPGLWIGRVVTIRSVETADYDGPMHVSVFYDGDWNFPEAHDGSRRCVFEFHSRPTK